MNHRLLSILLIISKKGKVTAVELANHFEVSIRTIYRDIEKLSLSFPIGALGGKGGGYYLLNDYNIDHLLFNKHEAKTMLSLMNSLNVLFGKNSQFNDIVLKFENSFKENIHDSDRLIINISHFSMETELKEYLYLMNKAIEESKLLSFDYINRRSEVSLRVVEPIQIVFSSGEWFLTAYCRNREGYRRFKLVRIRNLLLGDSFKKKNITNEELQNIFKISYDKKSTQIKLKFSKSFGPHLTESFKKEKIMEMDTGDFLVIDHFPYEEGLIKFIINFGLNCEVIEPIQLRQDCKYYLKKMIDKYND